MTKSPSELLCVTLPLALSRELSYHIIRQKLFFSHVYMRVYAFYRQFSQFLGEKSKILFRMEKGRVLSLLHSHVMHFLVFSTIIIFKKIFYIFILVGKEFFCFFFITKCGSLPTLCAPGFFFTFSFHRLLQSKYFFLLFTFCQPKTKPCCFRRDAATKSLFTQRT